MAHDSRRSLNLFREQIRRWRPSATVDSPNVHTNGGAPPLNGDMQHSMSHMSLPCPCMETRRQGYWPALGQPRWAEQARGGGVIQIEMTVYIL